MVAHLAGVSEADPAGKLRWDLRALSEADEIPDVARSQGLYPSCYNNLALSQLALGDRAGARRSFELAGERLVDLTPGAYADQVRAGIERNVARMDEGSSVSLDGRRLEAWTRLSSRVREVERILGGLDLASWDRRCASEGWSVGLVGCHISLGLRRQARWIERVLQGRRPHAFDWDRTHALNRLVARRVLRAQPADVLRGLAVGLDRWRRVLERATDADLARWAFHFQGKDSSVEWVAAVLAPRHVDEHLRSIRAALV